MYSKFGNDASQNEKGESLLNYLSKNEKSIYDQVILRLDSSYTEQDADGNRVKENDYYLEAFNAMSDIISFNPEFKKNKTLLNKIKEFINDLIGRDVIKDGKDVGEDVFDFITNYNKSVVFGRGNKTNIEASKTIDKKVNKDKTEELDNRVTPSKLSKSDFPNLLNNTAYKEFQESLKGITLYHGGNKTIDELNESKNDNWASWWYAGSPYGSMQYAGMASEENLDSDGFDLNYNQETRQPKYKGGKLGPYKKMTTELYKEKYSPRDQMYELEFDNIKDAIIIPDVEMFEDFSYFLYNEDIEDFQQTFKKGSKASPSDLSLYSYGDVVGILDLPAEKAEAILIKYMDYIKKYDEYYTDFFGGNKKGKLDTYNFKNNPVPLTVIGKINSNLIEKTESKQDDFVFIDEVYKEYDKKISSTKFSKTGVTIEDIDDSFNSRSIKVYNDKNTINLNNEQYYEQFREDYIKYKTDRLKPEIANNEKAKAEAIAKIKQEKISLDYKIHRLTEGAETQEEFGKRRGPLDNIYYGIMAGKFDQLFANSKNEKQIKLTRLILTSRLRNFDPSKSDLFSWLYGNPSKQIKGNIDWSLVEANKILKESGEKIQTIPIESEIDGDYSSIQIADKSETQTRDERKKEEANKKDIITGKQGVQGETRRPLKDAIRFKDQEVVEIFTKELGIILDKIKISIKDTKDFIATLREALTGRRYWVDEQGVNRQTS